ncbi:MAG: SseB family protein [Microbacteriaceae bacterium]
MNQNPYADSAGVPWEGRAFEPNAWAHDDGSANPKLMRAIAALQAGQAVTEDVIEEIKNSRLLIPLLAQLGDSDVGSHGQTVDKSADLSIVTVETPDQQDALPVFSSVAAMKAWNPDARPVPVDAAKAALAAASEGNTRMVLDAGNPSEFVIRRTAIAAIAQGLNWVHPVRDERVHRAFEAAVLLGEEILGFSLADADPRSTLEAAELVLELKIAPGLTREQLDPVLQDLAKALAASHDIAEYVDSLRVKLVA